MLIGIDIITPENVDLVILEKIGYIGSYRTTFELTIVPLIRPFLKRDILLGVDTPRYILVRLNIAILIDYINLPAGNDFIFKPAVDCPVILFVLLVNSSFHAVIVRNNSNILVDLPRKLYVSTVIDLDIDRYYYINNPDV